MKGLKFLFILLTLLPLSVSARQDNFQTVLRKIQGTYWQGYFQVSTFNGLFECHGPLNVAFFPMKVESFSGGVPTVSYRHHADFSQTDLFCQEAAGKKSPVDVGRCERHFPMKFSRREAKMVPFRTIIPRNGGREAVISSPSCEEDGSVKRQELKLARLSLSEDQRTLEVTIDLEIPLLGPVSEFTYRLYR